MSLPIDNYKFQRHHCPQFVGAIDAAGCLRVKAMLEGNAYAMPTVEKPDSFPKADSRESDENAVVWVYQHQGKFVKVETSPDMSASLWQKLDQYVQVLKPSE